MTEIIRPRWPDSPLINKDPFSYPSVRADGLWRFQIARGLPADQDPDFLRYVEAVEAADGQPLGSGIKEAYLNFIKGCKEDGSWDAIHTSAILAGARTLQGALVPLKGPSPTNFNFTPGDYSRLTGLKGDGTTKYLNTVAPFPGALRRSDNHLAAWTSNPDANTGTIIGRVLGGAIHLANFATTQRIFSRNFNNAQFVEALTPLPGLQGISRPQVDRFYHFRNGAQVEVLTPVNQNPDDSPILVFSRGDSFLYSRSITFYSAGAYLDLPVLNARVATLMSEIQAALS